MNKIAKYIMLLMTTLVITTAAVSCSKDSENEPDPTPTPSPTPTPESVSPIGYWRYQYTSSEEQEISVYNIREDNDLWTYSWHQINDNIQSKMEMHKCYFDKDNEYMVFYYIEESKEGEWCWVLFKVLDLGENVMTWAVMAETDDDNSPLIYGPFSTDKCQGIIDYYKGKPYDSSDIVTLKRISQDEFINWWNSVS